MKIREALLSEANELSELALQSKETGIIVKNS